MKDITIVTFISNNEKINEDFFTFYNLCKNNFNVEAIVFSDKSININDESIKLIIKSNTTKYIRIIQSIKSANSNNILFIDNDIIINMSAELYKLNDINRRKLRTMKWTLYAFSGFLIVIACVVILFLVTVL